MIICCGEALIDFMPVETVDGEPAFQPFNGGSLYNVAIALGRLGENVGFFGGLSNDIFGQMLKSELANSSVDCAMSIHSARATTLAFVKFQQWPACLCFSRREFCRANVEYRSTPRSAKRRASAAFWFDLADQ